MIKFSVVARQTLLLAALAGLSLAAQAQTNAVTNPGFETDFTGWGQYVGRIGAWSSEDADGSASSGSALLSNVGISTGIVPFVLYQCIPVQGGLEYEFGGDLRVPAGQPSGTAAYVFVEPFSNDHCAGVPVTIVNAGGALTGNWTTVSRSIQTAASTGSLLVALGVSKPVGETEEAQAYFDNIYLLVPESEGVVVVPSMSASWFNPAEGGHGIMIHLLNANTAWMCWFTFDLEGNPVWICALGVIDGDTITFDEAFTVEGGAFPPNFDPEQITEVPWGSIVVVFTGCDTGTMTWVTSAVGFQSGEMPIVRLTDLWGVPCSED